MFYPRLKPMTPKIIEMMAMVWAITSRTPIVINMQSDTKLTEAYEGVVKISLVRSSIFQLL